MLASSGHVFVKHHFFCESCFSDGFIIRAEDGERWRFYLIQFLELQKMVTRLAIILKILHKWKQKGKRIVTERKFT